MGRPMTLTVTIMTDCRRETRKRKPSASNRSSWRSWHLVLRSRCSWYRAGTLKTIREVAGRGRSAGLSEKRDLEDSV